jgi:hypothetical protein
MEINHIDAHYSKYKRHWLLYSMLSNALAVQR